MTFSPEHFKHQFPLFTHPENAELVYLDNAATTQKPQVVIDAIADFYSRSNANAHRSSHRLSRQATELLEAARLKAAYFFNASPQEIIFTSGATDALNILAGALGKKLGSGDEIILSTAEHHANLVPWQLLAEEKGLQLKFLHDQDGKPDIHDLHRLLSNKTRIVSLTAASNVFGFKLELASVKSQLPNDCVFIIDASQLAAHHVLDVNKTPCDFMLCSAHKFYGPTGVGLLYANKISLEKLPTYRSGGEMVENVSLAGSTFVSGPQRFEPGTSSLASIVGLKACLEFLQAQDRSAMLAYEHHLLTYCHQKISQLSQRIQTIQLLTKVQDNIGICSFKLTDDHSAFDLVNYLNEKDIAVRLGHHCAQPLLKVNNLESVIRISLAPYNSEEDIEKLVIAIDEFFQTQPSEYEKGLVYFSELKSWQAKNKCLMDWGNDAIRHPEIQLSDNLVKGCESNAWLSLDEHGQLVFDSDSRIIRGLMILLELLLKENCEEAYIKQRFADFGLERHLSVSRTNGFNALLQSALQLLNK